MGRSARGEFAYQTVYRYLETLIAQAEQGGDARLPSLRDLARRLRVSLATVQSAYSLLEDEGRVSSIPRSGYFVRLRSPAPTAWAAVSKVGGQSQPFSLAPLPSTRLERALLAQERRLVRQASTQPGQPRTAGPVLLRSVLAARYTPSSSGYWSAEDVHLATDVHALLQTLLAGLHLQDRTVVVATPCCWRVLQALHQAGMRVLEVSQDERGGLDLAKLERLFRREPVHLLLLPSCLGMPGGRLLTARDQQAVATLLAQYPTWLLENDLDSEHCFAPPPSLRLRDRVDPRRVLVLGSLEAVVGGEAPYAYVLGRHGRLREVFAQRGFVLPPLRQQAVAHLYSRGDIDTHLQYLRGALAARMAQLCKEVEAQLGAQLAFTRPEGGRALWCRLRYPMDMPRGLDALVGTALCMAPGEQFSLQGRYQQCLLLAWHGEHLPELREALRRLAQAFEPASKVR
ncbi:PLP-dependent aminotransferase family protein [Pseudomonas sp. NPDC089554]|uniref:aminotransferase-like domain-containing protein n=1 Tax=Pseudomonas sp. NPDC089554 TaxID=3390653 RepID=UPI003D00A01D